MDLYLLKYNNYYNRIIRKGTDLNSYWQYVIGDPIYRVNFVPNDGIDTEQIINWNNADPDYLLVVDGEEIVSRWFVMSAKRERGHQYRLILHRDVMADYSDDILKSTAYIKKALIEPSNPLIYNSEGMALNQIKYHEDLLYDKTETPWIVGYVAPNATELQGATIVFSGDDAPLTNYEAIKQMADKPLQLLNDVTELQIYVRRNSELVYIYNIHPGSACESSNYSNQYITTTYYQDNDNRGAAAQRFTEIFRNSKNDINNLLASSIEGVSLVDTYSSYNGKIVYDANTQTSYRISVSIGATKTLTAGIKYGGTPPTSSTIISPRFINGVEVYLRQNEYLRIENPTNDTYVNPEYNITEINLSLTPISYGTYSVTLHDTARMLNDAPYKMFCMKYTPQNYMLAINLSTNNGSKFYDIQLLPYCPVQNYFNGDTPAITGLTSGSDYEPITSGNDTVDYLFWATNSVFTFYIPYTVTISDVKIQNECDMYRICSPNGNGLFEFNAAKNKGVRSINVDCTYRPYDPYIHLNPDFGGLYGQDFNDFRGLVLNGDFSIPAINDAWTEYTIQNKNYQNIFNREIQSMDLQHKMSRIQDIVNIGVGGASGAMSGAITGGMVGGGVGAAVGGVVGGAASLGGGIADLAINDKLRADQKSLKQDLFSYSLQNIQALPQSVSKTGCLTNNNKLVPYVEFYTCTDKERQILRDKIKYQGMTVGAVGIVGDYVDFGSGIDNAKPIEADLIYLNINEDYHISMAIANELRDGIRFA